MTALYYLPPFLIVALISGLGLGLYRRSLASAGKGAVLGAGALYLLGPLVFYGGVYLYLLPELLRNATPAYGALFAVGAALGASGYALRAERPTWLRACGAGCAGALGGGFLVTWGFYTVFAYLLIPGALLSESGALLRHLLGA